MARRPRALAMNRTPYGQSIAGFQDARPTWQKALDTVQKAIVDTK